MISDMVLILLLQPFALDPEMEGQVAPVQRPPLILSGGPCVLPALALGINIQVRLKFSFYIFTKVMDNYSIKQIKKDIKISRERNLFYIS